METKKLHFLIVDNIDDNNDAVVTAVKSLEYDYTKGSCLKRASELLPRKRFDCFLINLLLSYMDGDDANIEHCKSLIEKIRDYYRNFLEYPIIVFNNSVIDNDDLSDIVAVGANAYLPFSPKSSKDQAELIKTIKRFIKLAIMKRQSPELPVNEEEIDDLEISTPEKLAQTYKLVVDLKTDKVYFKGIEIPSGKNGIQQRHKVFLFVLAKNPGRAMSDEEIHKAIRKFDLRDFEDRLSNVKTQIRNALKALAKKHPDKFSANDINSLCRTEARKRTKLTLSPKEIFTIHEDEEYIPL